MVSYTANDPRTLPEPPRLHWAIVLVLYVLTLGIFGLIWLVVQAVWVKRITGKRMGLLCAIVNLCAFPVMVMVVATLGSAGGFERLVFATLSLATVFTLRSEMENFPLDLQLSGVMTFFFGTIYFQYHLADYMLPQPGDVLGPMPEPPPYVPPISPVR